MNKNTHILLLPPGRVVTFTKLQNPPLISFPPKKSQHPADAPAVVENALLSTTLGGLFLLLLVDLWCLGLDFTSAGEGAVNYPGAEGMMSLENVQLDDEQRFSTFSHVVLRMRLSL